MHVPADLQPFIQLALDAGAVSAQVIDTRSIVVAAWVRAKCQFGCGTYGCSLCCPPHTPTPQQTQDIVSGYRRALLVHCHADVRPTPLVARLERALFLAGYYKALAFGAGPCSLCKKCNLQQCAHPNEARPAMEACGIDVYATVRANGLPIQVLPDRQAEENWYGLVLFD